MKKIDVLRRARANLAQAKVRTGLTSLAIAVGAFTITLSLAAGEGGRQYTDDMIKTSGDTLSLSVFAKQEVIQKNNLLEEYGAEAKEEDFGYKYLGKNDIENIKNVAGVDSVTPVYNIQSNYATRGDGYKKYIAPVSIKIDQTELKIITGSLDNYVVPVGGITISEDLLTYFGFDSAKEAIGKAIIVNFSKFNKNTETTSKSLDKTFKIVAVDGKSDATLYYSPSLQISVSDGRDIYLYQQNNSGKEQYNAFSVRLYNGSDILAIEDQIKKQGYEVYSLADTKDMLLKLVNIAQWGMVSFGALAIIASIFGIINTQYISVLERTQQIGLMKALGMRKKDVARLFRYEAAWVGFLGGFIGTILAIVVSFANPFIAKFLELDESVKVLIIKPLPSIILIASMMMIAVCAGYLPSRKAAKLDPIEALRTE